MQQLETASAGESSEEGGVNDWKNTPVFINNFCRLDIGFCDLLIWLRRAGMTTICVIDNQSTYAPLLDFYENSSLMQNVQLIHAGANLGHEAFWRLDLHLLPSVTKFGRYILTDADVVPDENCPLDLVRKMHEVADRFPGGAKVGPALRIDDLPECYAQREYMRFCESDYWLRKYPEQDCWNAAIDTTMSLNQAGWLRWPLAESGGVPHVRLDFPYVAQHRPWYLDSANLPEEEIYYRAHVAPGFSSSCMVPEMV
jgi:hypothetical protein